jgi:ubiquinone/menaquinone biosynthesis C-methylase UbiE
VRPDHEWQRWDVEGVAEQIDAFWETSAFEAAHRAALGDFCARYLTSREVRVLEVGCGTGRICEQLVPRLLPESGYAGIDVSERMLVIARRRLPGVSFRRGDGYAIDAADGAVDYTLAFAVLGHLPEVGPFLRELGRVARRGVLFTVWPATETEGVVDGRELVGSTEFLHRRYPTSWLVAQLASALPHLCLDLEIERLHKVWAYAVLRRDGAPEVSAPRLIVSGPGTSGGASP